MNDKIEMFYESAVKAGMKEYRSKISKGEFPYLPVLDQILRETDCRSEEKVGLIMIPLEFVVGTSTVGRTMSFASNFMPIMPENSEFGAKWNFLANAQVSEGIRDAVKVYEYLNRYYVVEGNKRVSVLKFFGADEVLADVTRKIPRLSDDPQMRKYYEWIHFTEMTGIYSMEFTKEGLADQILEAVGCEGRWDETTKENFSKVMFEFAKAYNFRGGKKIPITQGDALSVFLNVYGYETALAMTQKQYSDAVAKVWKEFLVQTEEEAVELVMDSNGDEVVETKKLPEAKKILSLFIPGYHHKKLQVAFLYPKSIETSDWVYAHELGRNYLQDTFPDEIDTFAVSNVSEEKTAEVIEQVIADGANIIFGVGPQMMKASLKAAVDHPDVKILNCSLNTSSQSMRTYYSRMYEAKFMSGMIAGAMTDNDRIAYIADYPIYGMIANINAFALGVASVNPRAKVYLDWSTRKNFDKERFLIENDIHYVSDQDMITPNDESRRFGLYHYEEGTTKNLVMPVWNWGVFYEKLIRRILEGAYSGISEKVAVNYWWGMPEGVVDVIFSKHVPTGIKRLIEHVHEDMCHGYWHPFYGEIRDQEGNIRNKARETMNPKDIMTMDYLVDNVIGTIPDTRQYIEEAKPVIRVKGVEEKTEG